MKKFITILVAGIILLAFVSESFARNHRGGGFKRGMGKGSQMRTGGFKRGMGGGNQMRTPSMPYEFFERKGLFPTGLEPKFPDGTKCPGISSPYGAKTRYDGSWRKNPHYGFHNGMDITLDTGTALLAVADGTVIHKGTAGRLVGNYIWLYFAPKATDLPVHLFVKYQHLDSPSSLAVGDKVMVGQSIGPSGNTGTTGGHFGSSGYPHLHIMYQIAESPDYTVQGPKVRSKGFKYLDPVGLFLPRPVKKIDNHLLRDLPDERKSVPVPVKTSDNKIVPSGSKVVWPVSCN